MTTFDVSYAALLHDPLGTIGSIYAHFGYPFSTEAQAAMSSWLRDNPQHKHGAHRYNLEDFGLDKDTVSQTFKEYIQEFQIEETR